MHPLENLDLFRIPPREVVVLPIVSVVVETRPETMDRIHQISRWHRKWFRFTKEIIISNSDPHIEGVTFVPPKTVLTKDGFQRAYSELCIRDLAELCDAPFILIWQWDGFIVNPELWTNEFLKYDYVGAPIASSWWVKEMVKRGIANKFGPNPVGNGGFSLRSKRFLEESASLSLCEPKLRDPEDFYLCVQRRVELEGKGIRFGHKNLASVFAKDACDGRSVGGCFGFHGPDHFKEVKGLLESKHIDWGNW